MADVKWIKITTDIFDDEKILLIESLPDAYAIITVWFKLLCLAGKQNNSGVFMMGRIPYTDKMLATIFRMKESTVTMALQTFEQFGMIEIVDGVITIPNWNKHQTLDAYEKKKARDRLYQQERRACQRALVAKSSDTSPEKSSDIAISEKEEDKDKEIELDNKDIIEDFKNPPPAPKKTAKKTKKAEPVKNKRGEYQHVLLTDEEEEKLIDEYGLEFTLKAITFLDEYIEETGYKRKSHYLSIKRWVIDAVKEKDEKAIKKGEAPKTRYGNFDVDDAFQIALDRTYNDQSKTAADDESVRVRMEALKQRIGQG